MQNLIRTLLAILFSSTLVWAQRASIQPSVEIARQQSQAVVIIEPLDEIGRSIGQGSGFIVTPNGAIITNLHVIRGASTVQVKLPNGDIYQTAELVDFDTLKDIAILKIKGFQLPIVGLGNSDRSEIGESIVVISSPEGLTNSLTTGVISGVRRLETHRVFQITAPISQGSSGGALFDSTGAVIGITTYMLRDGQNINFAVPINYARGMISDEAKKTLAALPPLAPTTTGSIQPGPTFDEKIEDPIEGETYAVMRRRLGRRPQEPMFARPDEALSFFYRLVEGIGLHHLRDVQDLARMAALVKTSENDKSEEYLIKYLSYDIGVAINFSKRGQLLESVDLLVNWSRDDLERTFGNKYKRRTFDGRKTLEFKKTDDGWQIRAFLDDNDNVRSIRFTKTK